MIDEFALHRTRELVNVVRYFDDRHDTTLGKQPATLEEVTDEFYRSAIEINEHLTPKLEQAIKNVCSRLKLQREVIHAFVNNSHEVQAACYRSFFAQTCSVRNSQQQYGVLCIPASKRNFSRQNRFNRVW